MQLDPRSMTMRRINADLRDMKTNPSPMYHAHPLEDNLLEWHFTIRGPRDTEFEGGVYHGRIVLPPEYPMKPPSIMLLTPNGRFEVRKMICLSISAFHPETWQPAWGIRLILEALISFMPTPGEGAVGAIDMPAEDRRILAQQSRVWECPVCGPIEKLIPEAPETSAAGASGTAATSDYAAEIAKLHIHSAPSSSQTSTPSQPSPPPDVPSQQHAEVEGVSAPTAPAASQRTVAPSAAASARKPMASPPLPPCDTFLTVLMWVLFACLLALLWRKWDRMG